MAPQSQSPRPRPPQPLPPHAPILQRPPTAASPPRPSAAGPHRPPTPRSAPYRTRPSRVPRAHLPPPPTLTTVPTSAVVPHEANTPSPRPPHSPAPPTAPTARAHDIRATLRPHGPMRGHTRTPTAPGPTRSTPPQPAAHASKHHPPAATHSLRTTAPPGCPGTHLPPVPRHRGQPGTARTAWRAHTTPTGPWGDAQIPVQHSTHPRTPCHQQCHPHTIPSHPPPPSGHRRTKRRPPPPPAPADTHHRGSPLSRPPGETPSPEPTRDNEDHRYQPTAPPRPHPAPPAAAPAEPYTLQSHAAVRQHLQGLGDQGVLRLQTSGTT